MSFKYSQSFEEKVLSARETAAKTNASSSPRRILRRTNHPEIDRAGLNLIPDRLL